MECALKSSPSDCYSRTPGLRVRPVPELGCCMVFTPAQPKVYTLNAAAWLLLELCEGQSAEALLAAFQAVYAEQGAAAGTAPEALHVIDDLERKGILVRQTTLEKETS